MQSLTPRWSRWPIWRYLSALVIIAAATALRWALIPWVGTLASYNLTFPAVVVVTILFGVGPGLLAAVVGTLAVEVFVLGSLQTDLTGMALARFGTSLAVAVAFVLILHALRVTQLRALSQSEARLRLAQLAAKAGTWEWDISTGHLEWSPLLFALFGLDLAKHEASFASWESVVHPDDLGPARAQMEEALRNHTPFSSEYRVVLPNGAVRWINALGEGVYDSFGRPVRMTGICIDITPRKQGEAELRQSQEDLARAQEVGQIGSWRLDVRHNVLTWSKENHRIFGVPEGTPLSYETFLEIVHPEDREYVDTQWQEGLRGEPYDIEHRLIVDGRVKWVREKAYLEFDDQGGLIGGFGITQDITARKEAEETLLETERARTRLAETLTSEIAHRTKNNLAIVAGILQLQLSRSASGPHAELLRDAIARIMSFSALHEQMHQRHSESVELLDALRRIAAIARQALSAGEMDLSVKGEEVEYPASVATNLCVVANELITNAVKHGRPNGGLRRIEVLLNRSGGDLTLSVWNSGQPVPPNFDVKAAARTGLALVRAIVEDQLGGSFTLRPERGGSLARVVLEAE